jgi:hypothetical protein
MPAVLVESEDRQLYFGLATVGAIGGMAATRALLKPARAGREIGEREAGADPAGRRAAGVALRVMPENLALALTGSERPVPLVTASFP